MKQTARIEQTRC